MVESFFFTQSLAANDGEDQFSYIHTTKEANADHKDSLDLSQKCHEEDSSYLSERNSRRSESETDVEAQADTFHQDFSDTRSHSQSRRTDSISHSSSTRSTVQTQGCEPQFPLHSAYTQSRDRCPIGPLKGLSSTCTGDSYAALEEACLIRHFTENLAHWVG